MDRCHHLVEVPGRPLYSGQGKAGRDGQGRSQKRLNEVASDGGSLAAEESMIKFAQQHLGLGSTDAARDSVLSKDGALVPY